MSKKKFTEGLESIFDTAKEEATSGTTALLRGTGMSSGGDSEIPAKKSSSRKSFTTDLDSLLQEALQEVIEEQMPQPSSSDSRAQVFHQQAHRRKPLSGLDILIRKTVESSTIEFDDSPVSTKRITVAFEKRKLEKLKKIARLEKAYLKDILGQLVAEYISQYESKKGEALD